MGPARVGARLDPGLTVTEGPVSYRSLRPDSEGRRAELRVWEGCGQVVPWNLRRITGWSGVVALGV